MRLLFLAVAASASSVINVASSSAKVEVPIQGQIKIHSPPLKVRSLGDLDPAIKVLGQVIKGKFNIVILLRADGSISIMDHNGEEYEEIHDGSWDPISAIFKDELKAGKLVPMDPGNHLILTSIPGESDWVLGDQEFESAEEAMNDPAVGALMNPLLRFQYLKHTAEWADKGLVVFHTDHDPDEGEYIWMVSHDLSRVFLLKRSSKGTLEEVPADEARAQHILLEISAGNIVPEVMGKHTIAAGYVVLSHDGARSVLADSRLTDSFLGPRVGMGRRIKCHTVPAVDESVPGSLSQDFNLVAHIILNNEMDADMVVIQSKADGSLTGLVSLKAGGPLSATYSENTDNEQEIILAEAKKLIESPDFIQENWENHTVYEWMELKKSFAIHTLSKPTATIVPMTSELPVVKFVVTAMDLLDSDD